MNIYIGNLSLETTEDELRETFAAFGDVATVKIVRDGTTGESRGFGFVGMPSESHAKVAIQEMNGRELKGQPLKVEAGRRRATSPGFSARRPSGQTGRDSRPGRRPGGRGGPGQGRR